MTSLLKTIFGLSFLVLMFLRKTIHNVLIADQIGIQVLLGRRRVRPFLRLFYIKLNFYQVERMNGCAKYAIALVRSCYYSFS